MMLNMLTEEWISGEFNLYVHLTESNMAISVYSSINVTYFSAIVCCIIVAWGDPNSRLLGFVSLDRAIIRSKQDPNGHNHTRTSVLA